MQNYTNSIVNASIGAIPLATITVTKLDGTAATLYSDNGVTAFASNVVTADKFGNFSFHAANGRYNISIDGPGIKSLTISDVLLYDPDDDVAGRVKPSTLSASDGATKIGNGTETVADSLNALQLADYTALRAYPGPRKSVYVTGYLGTAAPSGIAGPFTRDDHDTTTLDDGWSCIVAAGGVRFKRQFIGPVQAGWGSIKGDGSNETAKFNALANGAAAVGVALDLQGLTVVHDGGYYSNTAGRRFIWKNGGLKLSDGAKAAPGFQFSGVDTVDVSGLRLDGNRMNVSGNNAGFFVVDGAKTVRFDDIAIADLRRYGINIGGTTGCDSVAITRIRATDVGVQSAGAAVALGEAILVQNSTNVRIEGFKCSNPSGTGDGQVLKVFFCTGVVLEDINITDASPSKVYPALSCVRNTGIEFGEITVAGMCQVAMENNSNIAQTYRNITTSGTDKALILGTDGAGKGDRYSENTIIDNWADTSTVALAFNLFGAKGLRMRNVSTPQTINVSRDDPTNDRRTSNVDFDTVSCAVLNTFLINGRKNFNNVTVTGAWTNTSAGVSYAANCTFGSYSNGSTAGVFLCRNTTDADHAQLTGTLTASGGTLVFTAPSTVQNSPFSGEVLAHSVFTASGSTQWSKLKFDFYDWGTPTVLKTVIQSGTTPRSNIALAVARTARTLTFTNSETSDIRLDARVAFINNSVSAL